MEFIDSNQSFADIVINDNSDNPCPASAPPAGRASGRGDHCGLRDFGGGWAWAITLQAVAAALGMTHGSITPRTIRIAPSKPG